MKAALLYGIGEGDYHGRAFVAALEKAGFEVVRDARRADIVITHSGGCFFLPPVTATRQFVLINPPYWPGKPLWLSTIQKVRRDFRDFRRDGKLPQWLWKTAINIAHLIRYALKTVTITLHAHKRRFDIALKSDHTILIRSSLDPFLSPDTEQLVRERYGHTPKMYTVDGQHDSCWRDPRPYIKIIRDFASIDQHR